MTHTPVFPQGIPENIRKFIMTMLEKNPKKRAKIEEVLLNSWLMEKNELLMNMRMATKKEGDNKFAAYAITDIKKLDSNKNDGNDK